MLKGENMAVDNTTFEEEKLGTEPIVYTGSLDATAQTQEQLNALGSMITDLRAKVNETHGADAVKINSFIDKLEAEFIALQNKQAQDIADLQTSINEAVGADLEALTAKVTALNTFLNDEDPANAFISLTEYINTQKDTINALVDSKPYTVKITLDQNGNLVYPAEIVKGTAGQIKPAIGYEIVHIAAYNNGTVPTVLDNNIWMVQDLRYPTPKNIEKDIAFYNMLITVRKVATVAKVNPFTTAIPTA